MQGWQTRARMRGGIWVMAVLTALTGLMGGCQGGAATDQLGYDDAGQTMRVRSGDTFTLTLPAEPQRGYLWGRARFDHEVLEPVASEVQSDGEQRFTYRALAPGQTRLLLRYGNPMSENPAPRRTYQVQVEVQ